MISELSRAITAAMREVQLTSTNTTKLRKKLLAAVVDPLLPSMNLDQVAALVREGHRDVLDQVLRDMTLAQLKTVSKKWNPHRKINADVIMRDLQVELRDLVMGKRGPALDPGVPASWSLLDACARYSRDQAALIDGALAAMSLRQLKDTSKKWNPHRASFSRDVDADALRGELQALLSNRRQPTERPRQERALSRARRGATTRARLVAAE